MLFAVGGLCGLCSDIYGASASLGYLKQKCYDAQVSFRATKARYEHKWASPVALPRT